MNNSIKAIIFDFFGVISSEVANIWFLDNFPMDEARDLKDKYLMPVDLGQKSLEALFVDLGKLINKNPELIKAEWYKLEKINWQVIAVIKNLHKNYKIGLCSNSPSGFLHNLIAENNLADLFDVIVISSECKILKPDVEIFKLTLKNLNVNFDETILIDDNHDNIASSKTIGLNGITYKSYENLKKELINLKII